MTDRPSPKPPRSTREHKRWLVAALATGYVVAWWRFAATSTWRPASEEPAPERQVARPGAVRWLHELPPGQRPWVQPPAGWQVVTELAPPQPAALSSRRAVASRARRFRARTRSS